MQPTSNDNVRETAYWVALLRYIGCTGHAHEVATLFGEEIAIRAQTLVHDAANPAEVMSDVFAYATAGRSDEERDEIIRMLQQTAHEWAVHNFTSGCEVADMLVERLDFSPSVRESLAFTFERWNGKGFPKHAEGEAIPLPMRIVHLSHDMEAIAASSRRSARSRPPATAATGHTTRCLPISSSSTDPPGSHSSPRSTPGMPSSSSSQSHGVCFRETSSTRRSSSPQTSSTSSRHIGRA